jgi:putative oxidoreductase
MHSLDVTALLLRLSLGVTMLAHGWNHMFGGQKLAGTTRWFASIGMRPAWVHAWVASLTELGCGLLLVAGLLTPLAAGGVLGTMMVALITNHLRNGFFIFRPGEGYEYVLMICVVSVALAGIGGGYLSIDHAIALPISKGVAYAVCLGAGLGGSLLTLVTSWRPGAEGNRLRDERVPADTVAPEPCETSG